MTHPVDPGIGQSDDPKRPGPTCKRHWPGFHMDCELCRTTTNARMDQHIRDGLDSPLKNQEGGSHYKDLKIQPIEYIHANGIPFAEGNVIKYVTRWRAKGGIADLKKARHFLDLLIELEGRS